MNKRFAISLFCIGITLSDSVVSRDLTASEVFEKASASVVVVKSYNKKGEAISQGSGVVISKETVISNCHVFKDADSAKILFQNKHFRAELLFSNSERDLCSFTVSGLRASPAILGATTSLKVGEKVYAIGAPLGLELTLSDGLLSSIRALGGESLLQTTAPISPGSSGGGLFNSDGRLVGITTLYYKESRQINFAVPVEWIMQLPYKNDSTNKIKKAAVNSEDSAKEKGFLDLNALGDELSAGDPVGYDAIFPKLIVETKEIVASFPPQQWVAEARRRYMILYDAEQANAEAVAATDAAAAEEGAEIDVAAIDAAAIVDAAAAEAVAEVERAEAEVEKAKNNRWKLVYEGNIASIFVDTKTIKKTGERVDVWTRTVYSKPIDLEIKGVDEVVSLTVYFCNQRIEVTTHSTAYNTKLGTAKSDSYSEYSARTPIVPGSIGEVVFSEVCE